MKTVSLILSLAATAGAQNYTARQITEQGVAIVRLSDAAHGVEISVMPSIGNRAYEMKVHCNNILYFYNKCRLNRSLSFFPWPQPPGHKTTLPARLPNRASPSFD